MNPTPCAWQTHAPVALAGDDSPDAGPLNMGARWGDCGWASSGQSWEGFRDCCPCLCTGPHEGCHRRDAACPRPCRAPRLSLGSWRLCDSGLGSLAPCMRGHTRGGWSLGARSLCCSVEPDYLGAVSGENSRVFLPCLRAVLGPRGRGLEWVSRRASVCGAGNRSLTGSETGSQNPGMGEEAAC